MQTGAVIVAAGLSSRMKSWKPLLQLAGSTVIRTAIATLQSAGVAPIVVVTGREAELLERHLQPLAVICVHNPDFATTDMFHSAKIGLQRIRADCRRLFFLPGDSPLFSKRSLLTMMGYFDYSGCQLIVPAYKGRAGHPVLLDVGLIDPILTYSGDQGLKGALQRLVCRQETLELPDAGTIMDADRPEEYEHLKRYAAMIAQQDPLTVMVDPVISRREPFFAPNLARLLQAVAQSQSLRQACSMEQISYSMGWKWIKIAESQLGFPLLDSQRGGKRGGESRLTGPGLRFLETYLKFTQELEIAAETLFREAFAHYLADQAAPTAAPADEPAPQPVQR